MMFRVYVVRRQQPDHWRDFAGLFHTEREARDHARRAIASGYARASIAQGFDFIAHLDESSLAAPAVKPNP
jgi:hypothetical protein